MNDRLLRLSSCVVSRNCLSRPQLRSGRMEASDVRESRAPRGRTRPGRQHPPLGGGYGPLPGVRWRLLAGRSLSGDPDPRHPSESGSISATPLSSAGARSLAVLPGAVPCGCPRRKPSRVISGGYPGGHGAAASPVLRHGRIRAPFRARRAAPVHFAAGVEPTDPRPGRRAGAEAPGTQPERCSVDARGCGLPGRGQGCRGASRPRRRRRPSSGGRRHRPAASGPPPGDVQRPSRAHRARVRAAVSRGRTDLRLGNHRFERRAAAKRRVGCRLRADAHRKRGRSRVL